MAKKIKINDNVSKFGTFAKESEYKGQPVLSLMKKDDDKFPFTFGSKKAALIVLHIDEIKKFVDENVDMSDIKF